MGSEFRIFFDPLVERLGSMLIGQYWLERKEIKREERLAGCANDETCNDPAMPTNGMQGVGLTPKPRWVG